MRLQVVIARALLDVRGECATGVCYYSGIQPLSPSGILAATGIELGTPSLRGGRSTIVLPLAKTVNRVKYIWVLKFGMISPNIYLLET